MVARSVADGDVKHVLGGVARTETHVVLEHFPTRLEICFIYFHTTFGKSKSLNKSLLDNVCNIAV
jgi:hypothetical protein